MTATDLAHEIAEIDRDRLIRWVRAQGITSYEDAEDLVQRALLDLWRRASEVVHIEGVDRPHRAYLYGILHNLVRNHRRFQRRHPAPTRFSSCEGVEPATPAEAAAWVALRIELGAVCRRVLGAEDLRLLELHYHDRRSAAEIAVMLGSTGGAVKMRLHRIRKNLLAALRTTDEDPPPGGPGGRWRRARPTPAEEGVPISASTSGRGEPAWPRSEEEMDAWLREYAALCRSSGLRMFDHGPRQDAEADPAAHSAVPSRTIEFGRPSASSPKRARGRHRRSMVAVSCATAAAACAGFLVARWDAGVDPLTSNSTVSASRSSSDAGTNQSSSAKQANERSDEAQDTRARSQDPPRQGGWNSWRTEWWNPGVC